MSGFLNEDKAVLDSSKTFNTVSDSILVATRRVIYSVTRTLAIYLGKESHGQLLQAQLKSGCECHPPGTDMALLTFISLSS